MILENLNHLSDTWLHYTYIYRNKDRNIWIITIDSVLINFESIWKMISWYMTQYFVKNLYL